MTEANSYTTLVKGKQVIFKHIGITKLPPFKHVTSVSVIPFTDNGDIVAVRLRHRGLDLPGGHVEPGETTPEQTINREAMEEACITIKKLTLVDVIESDYFTHPSYMLLYGAFVDTLHPFVTPDDEMSDGREVVSPDEFIRQYKAGNKELMGRTLQTAWQKLHN